MSIQIKNLSYFYSPGTTFEKKAVDNISLEIKKGCFTGLIGHTGSGKSTFMQLLNALLKPTSGTVLIDGTDIFQDKKSLKAIRQKVGLVFQYPEHQLFEATVMKDVSFGPNNLGLPVNEIRSRAINALNLVGIPSSYYEKSPFELSGGQKRRVAIAGVLAMEPEILILDEPTAGLDPKGRDEILNEIKKMHQALNLTIILVSHSMDDIARLAEYIIVMHQGQAVITGSPSEVFTQKEKLEQIGLSQPQSVQILEKLKAKGFEVQTDRFTPEDTAREIWQALTDR